MIVRQIKVAFYHNVKTGEWCKDAPEKYGDEYYNDFDFNEYRSSADFQKDSDDPTKSPNRKRFWRLKKHVFTKFTNSGKLSKTELNGLSSDEAEVFKNAAEKKLATMLKLESETNADTKRALDLVEIVNSANWDNIQNKDLAVIKVKNSHSSWYNGGEGELHSPSEYLTVVPDSVVKEAKELQAIRRKHQNDATFDFSNTSYKCREIRVADHNNQDSYADVDSTNDDWTKIFNCEF